MSCNNNSFLDDLKKKLENVDFPEIDTSDVDAALSKLDSAIGEAETALNDALSDVTGFLNNAIDQGSTSLQAKLAELQTALTPDSLIEKIDEIKKEFGDDVDELDQYINNVTGGINDLITDLQNGANDALAKLSSEFAKGLSFNNPCDEVPNIQKNAKGEVVEQPKDPVVPTEIPGATIPPKNPAVIVNPVAPVPTFQTTTSTLDLEEIKAYIKRNEGLRLQPYNDSLGYPTIGYGHLIVEPGDTWMLGGITKQQADDIFDNDWVIHYQAATGIPGFYNAPDSAKKVLIDMTFNMGISWYTKWPGLVSALTISDYAKAAEEIKDSTYYNQVKSRAVNNVQLMQSASNESTAVAAVDTAEEPVVVEQVVEPAEVKPDINVIKAGSYIGVKDRWKVVIYNKQRAAAKMAFPKKSYDEFGNVTRTRPTPEQKAEQRKVRAGNTYVTLKYADYVNAKYGVQSTVAHWALPAVFSEEEMKAAFSINGTFSQELLDAELDAWHEEHIKQAEDYFYEEGQNFKLGIEIVSRQKP